MWRRRPPAESEVLRVGAHALERWIRVDGVLALQHSSPFSAAQRPQPDQLVTRLRELYSRPPDAPVLALLESLWMPIVFVEGHQGLSDSALEALVSHRFELNYGGEKEPPSAWSLRTQQGPRSSRAVAYGLRPSLKLALEAASASLGIAWAGWSPALDWGLQAFLNASEAAPWCIWPEQDRLIVVRFDDKQVTALHPGAGVQVDDVGLLCVVGAERVRLGLMASKESVAVAEWGSTSGSLPRTGGLPWRRLSLTEAASPSKRGLSGQVPA